MAESKDFVDISPEAGGSAGRKETIFQESEWDQILSNHSKLTLEGVEEKIRLWRNSVNKHVLIKYEAMKARCKNIAPSGITDYGKVILSRNEDGSPRWVKQEKRPVNVEAKPPKEEKKGDTDGGKKN